MKTEESARGQCKFLLENALFFEIQRKIISGGGLKVKAGDFPTVKVAFDVSNAVGEGTGGAAACTANVMYANEPGMTISFVD